MNKHVRQAILILAVVGVFALLVKGLNYAYVNDYEEKQSREFWHDFYTYDGQIDSICLGSSHVFCDVDPYVLSELSGRDFFNMANSALPMNGCYYLLKEADRLHPIKHVYLELFYSVMAQYPTEDGMVDRIHGDINRNWDNTDNMKPSRNRLSYKLAIGPSNQYAAIFLPFTRYRSELFTKDNRFNIDRVKMSLALKSADNYKAFGEEIDYGDGNGTKRILPKNFQDSTRVLRDEGRTYYPCIDLRERLIGEETKDYIRKIADYCKKQDIELTMFVSPVDRLQMMASGDYDAYVAQLRELSLELGVPYYDFNLVKEEYLNVCRSGNMIDLEHLNRNGAKEFSAFLWQVVSADATDNAQYFYNSYKEALESTPARVYGIYGLDFYTDENGRTFRNNKIACNHETGMAYRIIDAPTDGEAVMLQDYSANTDFAVCVDGGGTVTIYGQDTATGEVSELRVTY